MFPKCRSSVSIVWASSSTFRTEVAACVPRSRATGSGSFNGRLTVKKESRFAASSFSWCRLTGTFTRTTPRWP